MLFLKTKKKIIHFVGIGGIGMSGIAEVMHNLGYTVQGSDLSENANTKRLALQNVKIFKGHNFKNLDNVSYVVKSTAIQNDNPEIIAAKKLMIPIIARAEMLAELMKLKYSVSISGSHGKTTTTSLVAHLFEAAGMDPTVINGGIINNKSTNAYLGKGKYIIAEADESDATFIKIPSTIGVITNIDPEHMDYYQDFDTLQKAFKTFILNLPFYGFGVACIDHPVVRKLVMQITERRIITYAIDSTDATITAYDIVANSYHSTFNVRIKSSKSNKENLIKNVTIPLAGKHNILNSLAAIAIGIELDFKQEVIKNGFKDFQGVKRRFTKICTYNGADIIDDYAHHPVEIKATIATAYAIVKNRGGKIISIFQPHKYSRLENLFTEFADSFLYSNQVYILDVFSAGEEPVPGINSDALAQAIISNNINATYLENHLDIAAILANNLQDGDIALLMGAGSITKWTNNLPNELKELNKESVSN